MKVFTGTDIIEVNRIQKAMQDENFKERVFTEGEVEYCEKF
jgi:holo-[acyl-carrier protein] synthase